jgi:hypothetical protein
MSYRIPFFKAMSFAQCTGATGCVVHDAVSIALRGNTSKDSEAYHAYLKSRPKSSYSGTLVAAIQIYTTRTR